MAPRKRTRDYRAEEARRNARARELGFTSRAQMRRALRTGEYTPVRKSSKPRSPIVYNASPSRVSPASRKRRESQQWSNQHSRRDTSRYDPAWPDSIVAKYHAAYVDPDTRANRIENGLESLRTFLVDTMHFYSDDEFAGPDSPYGVSSHDFTRSVI